MTITTDTTVGQIAAEQPLATRVLTRHQIDYCCGGGLPLHEVCERKGLDAEALLEEIAGELESSDEQGPRWDEAPLDELIDHILTVYHRALDEELPRLEAMARKVCQVHGDKDPEMFSQLLAVYLGLKEELEQHMAKEEQVLFPLIRQGRGRMAGAPISLMEHEHDMAGQALARLRELTDDYQPADGACNTWRALWHGLAALEESTHRHIHLENNILFRRALAS